MNDHLVEHRRVKHAANMKLKMEGWMAKSHVDPDRSTVPAATPVVKTTVNLPPEAVTALRELATERGTSVADVIRRAIWIEKYLHDALKNGSKILLQEPDKTVKELVIR
jgi:ribbon-helix-helix CopG family protein